MKRIDFEIARKTEKNPGTDEAVSLVSFRGNSASAALSMNCRDPEIFRAQAAELRADGRKIECRINGRSVRIVCKLDEPAFDSTDLFGEARGEAVPAEAAADGTPGCISAGFKASPEEVRLKDTAGSALEIMLKFCSTIKFSSESVLDVFDFAARPREYSFGTLYIDSLSADKKAASIPVHAEVPDGTDPERIYEELMPVLSDYSMGIIKE